MAKPVYRRNPSEAITTDALLTVVESGHCHPIDLWQGACQFSSVANALICGVPCADVCCTRISCKPLQDNSELVHFGRMPEPATWWTCRGCKSTMVIHFDSATGLWPWRLGVSAASMTAAVLLTHALWSFVHYTPFLFGFAATILTVACAAVRRVFLRWPWEYSVTHCSRRRCHKRVEGLLLGFALVSGTFSWLVARR